MRIGALRGPNLWSRRPVLEADVALDAWRGGRVQAGTVRL